MPANIILTSIPRVRWQTRKHQHWSLHAYLYLRAGFSRLPDWSSWYEEWAGEAGAKMGVWRWIICYLAGKGSHSWWWLRHREPMI